MENGSISARVIGKQVNEPPVGFLVELGRNCREQLHLHIDVYFVWPSGLDGRHADAEPPCQLAHNRFKRRQNVHELSTLATAERRGKDPRGFLSKISASANATGL